jgi:hypothetical protein
MFASILHMQDNTILEITKEFAPLDPNNSHL